jgi:hypothetical protein
LIGDVSSLNVASLANGGNWIEDINTTEVLSFTPTKIVISSGINNLSGGDSAATIMTKLATLVASLTGGGYVLGTNLFITTLRPYTGNDVTATNALIRSTYSTSFIELYYPLWSGTGFTMNTAYASSDLLHLNEFGSQLEAGVYMNYFNIPTKSSINYSNKAIYADQQGRVAIGVGNIANYALDAFSLSSQIRFGFSVADSGGYLYSGGANDAEFYGGLAFNGSTYTYKSTSYSGVSAFGGDVYFWGATGVSAGSTTASPAALALLKSTGKLYIGGSTTPTAVLHLKAGTASANTSPLKFTSGTLLTSAEAGSVEFLTDKFYGTITTGPARKEFIQGDNAITDAVNLVFGTSTGTKLGTSASQKIGIWNATPIVQPTTAISSSTFVTNTSGIIDNTATWDGYTIGQVVKALRNTGLLA